MRGHFHGIQQTDALETNLDDGLVLVGMHRCFRLVDEEAGIGVEHPQILEIELLLVVQFPDQ